MPSVSIFIWTKSKCAIYMFMHCIKMLTGNCRSLLLPHGPRFSMLILIWLPAEPLVTSFRALDRQQCNFYWENSLNYLDSLDQIRSVCSTTAMPLNSYICTKTDHLPWQWRQSKQALSSATESDIQQKRVVEQSLKGAARQNFTRKKYFY